MISETASPSKKLSVASFTPLATTSTSRPPLLRPLRSLPSLLLLPPSRPRLPLKRWAMSISTKQDLSVVALLLRGPVSAVQLRTPTLSSLPSHSPTCVRGHSVGKSLDPSARQNQKRHFDNNLLPPSPPPPFPLPLSIISISTFSPPFFRLVSVADWINKAGQRISRPAIKFALDQSKLLLCPRYSITLLKSRRLLLHFEFFLSLPQDRLSSSNKAR